MRRLTLVTLCGTLLLGACSDQSRESPTEPSAPSFGPTTKCGAVPFPSAKLASLINKIFPNGKLRLEAVARAGVVALLWDTCQKSAAQKAVVNFVDWMNQNFLAGKLTGTAADRSQLITIMFNGVGLSIPSSTDMGPDFGIGFFDPNNTNNTVIKNQNNTALVELEPGSFTEPTTIVLSRKSDTFVLTNFDGDQFPPYFDYNAVNASGNHILENGKTAVVGFCLLDPAVTYPANPRIGHNPIQINKGAPSGLPAFEVLDPVDLAEEDLALDCGNLQPKSFSIGGFGQGLPGLANAAWTTAKYYAAPVAEALFLPQALHAAIVGTLPPPGGRASSLSPFGIVDATPDFTVQNSGETDPAGGTFTAGQPIDTCSGDSCFPRFRIDNGDGSESGLITATLIPIDGSTGTLSGSTSVPTGDGGFAEFSNLIVSAPGTYQLKFSTANSEPYVTGTFRVASATVTQLSCDQEGTVKSLESTKPVNLTFTNNTTGSVAVYWLNADGFRQYPFVIEGDGIGVPYKVLAPGESYTQGTYVTHPWLLESDDESAFCYGIFLPGTEDGEVTVGP